MVKQTLISFKVDSDQLALLDATCVKLGVKRNHLLNFLVAYGNQTFESYEKFKLIQAYSMSRSEF